MEVRPANTVYNLFKAGYRLFDCACDYRNEKDASQGVCGAIQEGFLKREDVSISTKL